MSPKKAKASAPTFRKELVRRAKDLGVKTEDLDRALVIGQLAGLLVRDPGLRGKLAHKGAAVLRLVDQSERLSRDLDRGHILGQRVGGSLVVRALSTEVAKRVVLRATPNRPSKTSISFFVECRALRGAGTMPITVTINRSEAFMLKPVMATFALPDGTPIQVPVMHALERAAEKVRAFLTRGDASDAYDLWWYWTRVLVAVDRTKLPGLIKRKCHGAVPTIPGSADVIARFDEMRAKAQDEWKSGTGLVIAGAKPEWSEVDGALKRFKGLCPRSV